MIRVNPFLTTVLTVLTASAVLLHPATAFSLLKMQSSYTPPSPSSLQSTQNNNMSPTSTSTSNSNSGLTSSHDLFSGTSTTQSSSSNGRTTSVNMSPLSKYFQLEEREDKESCTTEIFLREDGTVAVFDTDGPPPTKSTGWWSCSHSDNGHANGHGHDSAVNVNADGTGGSFVMTIVRTFTTGSDGREMGEFTFDVERKFEGTMSLLGGKMLAMEGSIHLVDEFRGDISVGYFSMIDTTKAKLGVGDDDDDDDDDDQEEEKENVMMYQRKTTI